MAHSYLSTTATGSTTIFTVDFPFLQRSHVKVYSDGVEIDASTLTWLSDGQVQLPGASGSVYTGKVILRQRVTPDDGPYSVFQAGAFDHGALNKVLDQMVYLAVERADATKVPYKVAHLPSASASGAGALRYCTNETGGAVMVFSDGTNWRRVTDRAVAS